jgi:antitoxin ParD1/3/4
MAALTVTLPSDLGEWVEAHTDSRESASDFVCALVERERVKQAKIAAMQEKIDEGLASGVSTKTMSEIQDAAIARAKQRGLL